MISVIIPVYNAESYLSFCIDSILAQSYPDFELILVNDGSTDDSLSICKMYAADDSRIKCISITNSGANQARKVGVGDAVGDYIMFVDADDTIAVDALEKMLCVIERNPKIDIVVGHMKNEYEVVSNFRYLIDTLSHACWVTMYYKIYKANILKNYFIDIPRFLNYGEDLIQNANLSQFVGEIVYCDVEYYCYRSVETSITHTMQFSQEYENTFQSFLVTCLFKTSLKTKLGSVVDNEIDIAWGKCYLDSLKTIGLNSSSFDFNDLNFQQLRMYLKPCISRLGMDDRILLYWPRRVSLISLRIYNIGCRFKKHIKTLLFSER